MLLVFRREALRKELRLDNVVRVGPCISFIRGRKTQADKGSLFKQLMTSHAVMPQVLIKWRTDIGTSFSGLYISRTTSIQNHKLTKTLFIKYVVSDALL